jgi:hypothetical protein
MGKRKLKKLESLNYFPKFVYEKTLIYLFMKKITLVALLFSALLSNAQIFFEDTEGYTLGAVAGQNGWGGTTALHIAQVSNEQAAGFGAQSLKIQGNNGTIHTAAGAISSSTPYDGDIITVSFDVYFTASSTVGNESDFFFSPQSPSQQLITSRIRFIYDGTISVIDGDPGALAYVPTGATFDTDVWYNFSIVHNVFDLTVEYYLDGVLIYTGQLIGATNVENFAITNDNYDSSAYFDNITVTASLANNEVANSKFSTYPNPAKNVINVANTTDALISTIEITDLNGRIVKTSSFSNISEAQVSVSELAQGIYTMKIVSDKGTVVKKIIKE